MTMRTARLPLAAALLLGLSGAVLARGGGGDAGSGLSPYAVLSGNDRSAGVNNGNYRKPIYDPYLQTYDPVAVIPYEEQHLRRQARRRERERLIVRPYYGGPGYYGQPY